MAFARMAAAGWSMAARLDMVLFTVRMNDTANIRRKPALRYMQRITSMPPGIASRKSEPGWPWSPLGRPGGQIRTGGAYDAGIRTVSTTWITPFDWLTFGIVTVA